MRKRTAKVKHTWVPDGFKRPLSEVLEAIVEAHDTTRVESTAARCNMVSGVNDLLNNEVHDESDLARALLIESNAPEATINYASECNFCEVFMVNLTERQAMKSPDKEHYMKARTVERVSLEAKETWRLLKPHELKPTDRVLPCVALYQRKSDGRWKCRLVVLGNREAGDSSLECYSPTVSATGTRMVFVEAASRGMHISQYDISVAFVNALSLIHI